MYLSSERLALANEVVKKTFEDACVAWQTFPQWVTGDPAQTEVRLDNTATPGFVPIQSASTPFEVTLAEVIAPTPDSLLSNVIANTVLLAAKVDAAVVPALRQPPPATARPTQSVGAATAPDLLDALIDARAKVETAGYRAPTCLITNTVGVKKLSQFLNGVSVLSQLLDVANCNSLQRVDVLEDPATDALGYMIGRRQRLGHQAAAEAFPGEEPVDIAVSVPPSLEVIGDTPNNTIKLAVRVRFATRVKDVQGLVVFVP
ncbi:hypothetical protein HZU40_10585 [Mycolicibacterium fluoranthenivorans]|uniref:Phage major capsid protein n=1 Tax=Mycolicibacterium fluoranthenivorans TaxID=258505 RepID=A0A7G8PJZ2_9MYCO|nr:hypothetical protein [Mycolicibacterium fluoranthenivorans]QNJ94658.1 hypothetical protein HZU40_10585 [Mycolicibacterium fluoranthenivorans]